MPVAAMTVDEAGPTPNDSGALTRLMSRVIAIRAARFVREDPLLLLQRRRDPAELDDHLVSGDSDRLGAVGTDEGALKPK